MKIAVNTRLLLKNRLDGIGWFTYETLRRITLAHPEVEFHFFFDREYDPSFVFSGNVKSHVVHPQARHPLLFRWWFDFSVPLLLRRIKPDLFVSTDAMLSLGTHTPQLLVIHDLNFEHYPNDIPSRFSKYLRKRTPLFAKKANRICTVSEFSKSDIAKCYGIAPDLIDVVYNGVNENFVPLSDEQKLLSRKEFSNSKPYFVFVSSLHPRKNLHRLLLAFDDFKQRTGADCNLVVVGKKFWLNNEMEKVYNQMAFKEQVIFTGWLPPEELHRVVGGAIASVYISYFEGFGIPLIEAFSCGVPVITSNVTSMPEVAKEAALLVDPFSVSEISDALEKMFMDENLRIEYINRGFMRVKDFSWDRTSGLLWRSMVKAMDSKDRIVSTTGGNKDV